MPVDTHRSGRPPALGAVDLGASGGKLFAGVLEAGRLTLKELHRFANGPLRLYLQPLVGQESPPVEKLYWNELMLYGGIIEGLRKAAADPDLRLVAVGIDTWGSDGALLNGRGEILGHIHCYRDHRLDDVREEMHQIVDARRLFDLTGMPPQQFQISAQLFWATRHQPDLLAATKMFLPLGGLLNYYLCGARCVEYTWISVSQLTDSTTRGYCTEVFERLGLPLHLMPPIVEPGTRLGRLHAPLGRELGLEETEVIAPPMHDTACAFLAAPVSDDRHSLIISTGTWSIVGQFVPRQITCDGAFLNGFSNEGGVGDVRFLRNVAGTWIMQELRRGWALRDGREMHWREMNEEALAAPPFACIIDPDDAAFYHPDNMETAIADYCQRTGQRPPSTRGSAIRTAMESLALKYAIVRDWVAEYTGNALREVYMVGGGTQNDLLNQWSANAMDLPVVAGPVEATATGNILVQAASLGMLHSLEEMREVVRQSFPLRRFTPRDGEIWARAKGRLRELLGL